MRIAAVVAALVLPLTAAAGPFRDVIKQPARRAAPGTPKAFTNVSHTIFLNRCPGGCTVYPGEDDSRTNHSTIATQQSLLVEWPHGDAAWGRLVQCVRDMYAPFDIQITDVDPGNANHFEVMVAGNAAALDMEGAGGVAPFEPCDGQLVDNVTSFVFAADISNEDFLCWAAAQESAHVFGLDHLLDARDPMTYLTPPIKKEGFQNQETKCGEDTPRECWCGGTTQNSYQYLMDTFGPSNLEPATLAIVEPADGAWVKPGFNVRAQSMSQLSVVSGSLLVDGAQTQSIVKGQPLVFNGTTNLAGGQHTIGVSAIDTANRTMTAEITVNVTASCAGGTACAVGHCLGGYCLPGADVAGGLGAPCQGNSECITGTCGSDGTTQLCTGACDAGNKCPDGYACLAAGASGVCWPSDDEGGCSTSGSTSPLLALFGLGFLFVIVRRRR